MINIENLQPFIVSSAEFKIRTNRVISIIKGFDKTKWVSTQLLLAAACFEIEDLRIWLSKISKSEKEIFTGALLSCSPSLDTYIKRFNEIKEYLFHSDDSETIWIKENMDYLSFHDNSDAYAKSLRQKMRDHLENDLKVIDEVKNHWIVGMLDAQDETKDYYHGIDTWVNGLRTDIPMLLDLLCAQCDDIIYEIKCINNVVRHPSKNALAKGLAWRNWIYKTQEWQQEKENVLLQMELSLKEYNEDDKEELLTAKFDFYDNLKKEIMYTGFIQKWQKHLGKSQNWENYLSLAQEMLNNWGAYNYIFKENQIRYRFNDLYLADFINSELRQLRRSERHDVVIPVGLKAFVIRPELEHIVINRIVELVNRQDKPKAIVMPIRAAIDAGVMTRPNWESFIADFGNYKLKSKSSFSDYTDPTKKPYDSEAFYQLVEEFKKML